MTDTTTNFDFNTAGEQRSFDVIPANTICTLQLTIRPGGAGDGGWLKRVGRWRQRGPRLRVHGRGWSSMPSASFGSCSRCAARTPGHAEAGEISRNTLRAILESARGIQPDDKSEAAQSGAQGFGLGGFRSDLRFVARLGVRPPKDGYAAKNTILEVITPERQAWKKPEQISAKTGE